MPFCFNDDANDLNPGKNLIVAGKMQAANKPNANKRIYEKTILEREVNKYILSCK